MSARLLLALFDFVYGCALAVWIAAVLAAGFALRLAAANARGDARRDRPDAARPSLARFYSWGATAGSVALAALVCGTLSVPELRGPKVLFHSALLVGGILLMLHAANGLAPALQVASERGQPGEEPARHLHRRAFWLNLLAIANNLALVTAFALRPAPLTAGIVEPSPRERVRREEKAFRKARERVMRGPAQPVAPSPDPR